MPRCDAGESQGHGSTAASHGFPPVIGDNAKLLIVGSLPGVRSIRVQQYFAHPRNVFWRIVDDLFGVDASLPYASRCASLTQHGIALWDVVASSIRPGSADSAIRSASVIPNDFNYLLGKHPDISTICCNGGTARRLFDRHVLKSLGNTRIPDLVTLPSTSPAYAAMPYEEKLNRWLVIRGLLSPSG